MSYGYSPTDILEDAVQFLGVVAAFYEGSSYLMYK